MTEFVDLRIEDVLGVRSLSWDRLTIGDLLRAHRLPETMFQPYALRDGHPLPLPLSTPAARLRDDDVLIRAIRNTLFPTILDLDSPDGSAWPEPRAGVGFTSLRPNAHGTVDTHNAIVDEDAARALVIEQVETFAHDYDVAVRGCMFGVSGGGDSNALAHGLARAVPADRLMAFTLVFGAVFTEKAADRATVLCQDLGIEHRVLWPDDIDALLGITTSLDELYKDFCEQFSDEALHFFGTFLIVKVARVLASERGFGDLAFGYNREDLLAEMLFMVMNGRRPLAVPARIIGDHRIVMPVWKVPKLLLDACHHDFSLENYRERDPYTTRQRSLAFFLSHGLDSLYPGFGLSTLVGLSQAFEGNWGAVDYDPEMDVFLTSGATVENVERVRVLLGRHLPHHHG